MCSQHPRKTNQHIRQMDTKELATTQHFLRVDQKKSPRQPKYEMSKRQHLVSHTPTISQTPRFPKPTLNTTSALEALSKQGVGLQQVTVPRDLVIPTGTSAARISLTAGQSVMVIRTPKGIY